MVALWISRPELRHLSLEFHCVDQAGAALEAGKRFFAALSGGSSPWNITTIRAAAGFSPAGGRSRAAGGGAAFRGPVHYGSPARLVTAVNFFNELYENIPHSASAVLRRFADKQARFLSSLTAEDGSLLIVEPGVPRSGEFTAALRASLLERGRRPVAPCPHAGICPCPGGLNVPAGVSADPGHRGASVRPGGKGRWCHFAFETKDAAPALLKLSAAAGLPKERAVLSFLYCGPALPAGDHKTAAPVSAGKDGNSTASLAVPARIISDPFPIHSAGEKKNGVTARAAFGRYGCCEKGLVLIRGSRELAAQYESGTLAELAVRGPERRDPKSRALIIDVS
jgi:hypothetical protein